MIAWILVALGVLVFWLAYRLRHLPVRLRSLVREARDAIMAVRVLLKQAEWLAQLAQPIPRPRPSAEPFPFDGGEWDLIAGNGRGWPAETFYKVRGLVVHGGDVYASLTGAQADGPRGEVWRWARGVWGCVGGEVDFSGSVGMSSIDHLFSSPIGLLAAHRRGVFCWSGQRWSALSSGLALDAICGPYSFADWAGRVVMGQWGRPRVAVLGEDCIWSYLPDPDGGWGPGARTIYALQEWKGQLYAATGTGKTAGPASSVWRFDGQRWEQVGGNGIRGSWSRDGIPFVLSLGIFDDRLVATLSRPPGTAAEVSNVWVFDGDLWGAWGVRSSPALMAKSLIMNDVIDYRGHLVVATGHGDRRPAAIWALSGGEVWRSVGPEFLNHPGQGVGGWWVYRLCTDGHYLYAALGGHKGAAAVLRFTPGPFEGASENRPNIEP
jgi:hypothetical protein